MSEQQYDWAQVLTAAGITPSKTPLDLRGAIAQIAAAASGGGGGGGFTGTDWITASGLGDITVDTSGTQEFAMSVDGTNGSPGWTLNADTIHWDCTDSGLYAVYFESLETLPTGAIEEDLTIDFDDAGVADPFAGHDIFVFQSTYFNKPVTTGSLSITVIPWSIMPMHFTAGDAIGMFVYVDNVTADGPIVLSTSSTFTITRLA